MASEFEVISALFQPLSTGLSADEMGIGDDGAVLNVPDNHQLVVVTDTLVSGVHFPEHTSAYDIAWKAVAVNLSDLAAMGAKPGFYSLALTIPNNDEEWLIDFSRGLKDICSVYHIPLIGGDTTKGPLTISVTAQGFVEHGKAVKRCGAKKGNVICVTNSIGDGALGLMAVQDKLPDSVKQELTEEQNAYLQCALNRPIPQLALSEILAEFANSAIDISDGLLADLGHILESSNVGLLPQKKRLSARIEMERIPLSTAAQVYIEKTGDWKTILSGGDDYQICLTLEQRVLIEFKAKAELLGIKVSQIGWVYEGAGTIEIFAAGKPYHVAEKSGYLHF